MLRLLPAAVAALLLVASAPVSHAQQTPKAADAGPARDEGHALASQFLDKIGSDAMMIQLLGASRASVIVILKHNGQTEQKSGEIFDQFMLPEFRRRLPELRAKFEDILATDFTVPELHAILDNQQNEARQSAIAKAGQLQTQFSQAGQTWGQQVGIDVYDANKDTFHKLGLDNFGGPQK